MKISKLLAGLALVCSMGSAMAATSTVTGVTGTTSYTFADASANTIGTLDLTISGGFLYYSFTELSAYLGDATSLIFSYKNNGSQSPNNASISLTTGVDVLASTKIGGRGATFSGATLTYSAPTAPVPEPETYAMLLAGLGLMGAIARRRSNKQA